MGADDDEEGKKENDSACEKLISALKKNKVGRGVGVLGLGVTFSLLLVVGGHLGVEI